LIHFSESNRLLHIIQIHQENKLKKKCTFLGSNTSIKHDGLSIKQKTIMKHTVLFLLSFLFSFGCANAQSGMTLVADIFQGTGGSNISPFTKAELNGILYFTADDGINGTELWRYDGTSASLVIDLNPGPQGSAPLSLTVAGNLLFFVADDGVHGRELWKFDGTSAALVQNIHPGTGTETGITVVLAMGNEVFFDADNGVAGKELWKSNGTTTTLVADINPGSGGSFPGWFTAMDSNTFYFSADDGNSGTELFRFSSGSVSLVYDLASGSSSSFPFALTPYAGNLCFVADDWNSGYEWWQYNPNSGVVSQLADICPGSCDALIFHPYVANGNLYFSANDNNNGQELWIWNGTQMTTQDIYPGPFSATPAEFIWYNNQLMFGAANPTLGIEWHRLTNTGFEVLSDINPGPGHANILYKFPTPNALYFSANNGTQGNELWQYNGQSFSIVTDLNPGITDANPIPFALFNNDLLVIADNGSTGSELWKLDITVGHKEFDATTALNIYPNPSIGPTVITIPETCGGAIVQVFDLQGNLVSLHPANQTVPFNLEAPTKAGTYLVIVNCSSGLLLDGKWIVIR
jgi:ELWxxDGT repeat protein